MPARYVMGIDVGGTKIYAGIVDAETGKVLATARKRTHPERGVDFFSQRLLAVAQEALDAAKLPESESLLAIGIGIAGQVDRAKGVLLASPNLAQGLRNLALADLLQKQFNVPAVVGNDVEVAAYGEQQFGAGRGYDDFVCVFVGTGVGSAIMQGGQIRRGFTGIAGEIGHTIVQYGGRICGCGGRGHLEAYASRSAVTRVLLAELARGRPSKLRDLLKEGDTAIRSKMIARCIDDGDELVIETVTEAADYLGAGLGSLATFYNPQCIVVGGGLIEAAPLVLERATLRAHEAALPAATRSLTIVEVGLGDDSGIIGAAWMAARQAHD
ncbi:MAG TPA: ROK family protein [Ktedonobacterales bacterium]|jgi:glucokinase|nr:ROK family protein [Ktedonobacterales bacterium]